MCGELNNSFIILICGFFNIFLININCNIINDVKLDLFVLEIGFDI